jgi:hypothetical protein
MVGDLFPELEDGAAQALLSAAVKHSASREVVQLAGLLVTAGRPAAQGVEAAVRLVKESGAAEILRALHDWAAVQQRWSQGRLHEELLPLAAALAKKWAALGQAPGQTARPNRRGRA